MTGNTVIREWGEGGLADQEVLLQRSEGGGEISIQQGLFDLGIPRYLVDPKAPFNDGPAIPAYGCPRKNRE